MYKRQQLLQGKTFELKGVAYPLLMAATIGQAARCHRTVFTTTWGDIRISCFENGLSISGPRDQLELSRVERVSCFQDSLTTPDSLPSTLACSIDDAIFSRIDAVAFETYAPATEASRAGAGAGLTDND